MEEFRPATEPHELMGQRILEAAYELIVAHGYSSMSMRKLAAQVGLHAGSLYHHYRGKEDVLEAVIEFVHDKKLFAWMNAKRETDDPREAVARFVEFSVRYSISFPADEQLIRLGASHFKVGQLVQAEDQNALFSNELKKIIYRGVQANLFQVESLEISSHCILGLCSRVAEVPRTGITSEARLVRVATELTHRLLLK
ncbi:MULTISPECIES: TetR/AcrR family transcriptional regulator [unclassified Klebsiella]|uniref:TetR/AcrR family transcriptional regulator n=1 Tax=unclassified Klebsiella TaxID=2608929 RepID=UPI000C2A8C23|nr:MULTISPECIES: TetR/AcrR family transcriptional regulator [unclassified Klebsiella]PJX55968.1 hypothetical protein CWM63_28605 [Klebsiella sp. F-Nf9]PKJ69885.1 hypothetical protein CW267_14955 [Klebsiella sp. X1-16S-Nf21]